MKNGKLVEAGPAECRCLPIRSTNTRTLLAAVPRLAPSCPISRTLHFAGVAPGAAAVVEPTHQGRRATDVRLRHQGQRACPRRRCGPPPARTHCVRGRAPCATFCSTSSTATPSALMRRMLSNTSTTTVGREARATARRAARRRGRAMSARAIATICCWPPDSVSARCSSLPVSIGNSAHDVLERLLAAAPWHWRDSCRVRDFRAPSSSANRRAPSGTMAMPFGAEAMRRQPREVACPQSSSSRR